MHREIEDDKTRRRGDAISLEYYIAHLLLVLECARIWPVKSFSRLKASLSTGGTIIFITINSLLLLSEIVAVMINNDLTLFANIIGVISMHGVGLVKWCYCIRKNREIVDIVTKLKRCHTLCQRLDNSEEGCRIYRDKMEYVRKYSNIFIQWWTITCIYGVLHWCANPLLLEWSFQTSSFNHTFKQRNLPFVGWYPLNTNDFYNYVCLYLVQIIGGISPALGIVCYDSFYVTMLMAICVQFQYINIVLTKINSDNKPEAMSNLDSTLKNCVNCHVEIIRFLKILQNFSGPTMFVQCIETLIILCLVSFEASVIKIAIDMVSVLKLWALLEYFLCAAFQLYVFCFFATQIKHLGLQMTHSVYCCEWELVSFGKREQFRKQLKRDVGRLVQTITIQAQRPIVLTGGPFYVLSLETFRVIMSMAMSNSVMLRTIHDRDE
ncbi:odorant receptor 4 [Monomorium pharaonis]|uniref:odorant receptor 4 n=1 Tax=Monomorium pharaonis TaxID=307658 RepID=UPI001745FD8A|nr:odorant receptor 4 [Monomorium pharaonis]